MSHDHAVVLVKLLILAHCVFCLALTNASYWHLEGLHLLCTSRRMVERLLGGFQYSLTHVTSQSTKLESTVLYTSHMSPVFSFFKHLMTTVDDGQDLLQPLAGPHPYQLSVRLVSSTSPQNNSGPAPQLQHSIHIQQMVKDADAAHNGENGA
jgi:hypothetical protein